MSVAMKPQYMLYDLATGEPVSVYMPPSAHHQTLFDSVEQARSSNCNGVYADRTKYGVKKVVLEAGAKNVDPATEQETKARRAKDLDDKALAREMDEKGITDPWERLCYAMNHEFYRSLSGGALMKAALKEMTE